MGPLSAGIELGFGVVPDGVITLAFDKNDPVSGLYLRTHRGLGSSFLAEHSRQPRGVPPSTR